MAQTCCPGAQHTPVAIAGAMLEITASVTNVELQEVDSRRH